MCLPRMFVFTRDCEFPSTVLDSIANTALTVHLVNEEDNTTSERLKLSSQEKLNMTREINRFALKFHFNFYIL